MQEAAHLKLVKRAGLEGIQLHDLRHFHAIALLKSGIHLKVVQERLGHTNIAITADTYSYVSPGMQQAAGVAFAKMMDRTQTLRGILAPISAYGHVRLKT